MEKAMHSALDETRKKRWLIFASLMSVFAIGYFHRVAPAVTAGDIMRTFQTTGAALAALSSAYFYIYAFMQIPSGILSDTMGPRLTVALGAAVMGAGAILFGIAPNLFFCYAGRFLIGFGVSVFMVNTMRICVEWFRPDELGRMNGLTTAVGGVGALLAATPLALLSGLLGWRLSFVGIGVVSLLLAWCCWRVIRNRPADCGLPSPWPSGSRARQVGHGSPSLGPAIWQGLKRLVRNPYTWPPFFGFFALYSTLMAFSGLWGIPFFTQVYGISTLQAADYVMTVSLGVVVGCPIVGFVSDRALARRKLPYVTCACAYALIWAILCFSNGGKPPLHYLYPLCFAMGFFCSAFILSIVTTKEVNDIRLAGIAMGTCNTGGFIGAALMQIVLGKTLDLGWDGALLNGVRIYPQSAYRTAFIICFFVTLIGLAAAFLLKETHCRDTVDTPPALSLPGRKKFPYRKIFPPGKEDSRKGRLPLIGLKRQY
jgi:sugar phosphate permease